MGKVSNVITMASLLSNGRKYGIKELATELEVTPRMIRVYKEELEKTGIYIDTIRGPYGGYVLNQGLRLPNRSFNKKDVDLLLEVSKHVKDNKIINELNYLVDKINGIYKENKDSNIEIKLSGENLLKFNLFNRAIKEKRKVKILYYSFNKGDNERIIHPYDMFLYSNGWGVASYCEIKKDIRHFEFNRIKKYELLEENFE